MKKIVAIHQPNFFPWLGYFDKIIRADVFIFLDNVQYPKGGGKGNWSNRVKIISGQQSRWFTAPVNRSFHGTRAINEIEFVSTTGTGEWREKLLDILCNEYKKHTYFAEVMSLIEPLLLNKEKKLATYNINAITEILKKLGVTQDKLCLSSSYTVSGRSNELLYGLTRIVGGSTYMCGGGASEYQNDDYFIKRGVKILYQNYSLPSYEQRGQGSFLPGLSIIDCAMNLGWNGVKQAMSDHATMHKITK